MDSASAIASLISFSIQSAKVVYQVLQTLNASQDKVAHSVAIKTNKLRADLERFEKGLAGRQDDDPELEELMTDCHAVLGSMCNKLQKFQLNPGDKLHLKLWKAFRAATSDAELKKFQNNLDSYSTRLIAHLGISTNEKVLEIYDRADDHHATVLLGIGNIQAEIGEMKAKVVNLNPVHPCGQVGFPENSCGGLDGTLICPATVAYGWTAEQVIQNSQMLDNYFDKGRLHLKCPEPAEVGRQTLIWLKEWSNTGSLSGFRWLRGPPGMSRDVDNEMTKISAKLVETAEQAGVRMISYFCSRALPCEETSIKALTSLLYALMRQIIIRVPLRLHLGRSLDLSEYRFRQLDGTREAWDKGLTLLQELLNLMPEAGTVYCVVDGFHWVDKSDNKDHTQELLQVLQAGKLNILFVTTSRSESLVRVITSRKNNLDVEFVPGGKVDLGKSSREFWGAEPINGI